MDRRRFLQSTITFVSGCAIAPFLNACGKEVNVRFGLITDLHYAFRESNNTRCYKDSLAKTQEALDVFEKHNLDFIIELGDLKDQGLNPQKEETISYLRDIEKLLQSFSGRVYHVLGNHDMDSISKLDFLSNIKNPDEVNGKSYYSFKHGGLKFIVLDANFREDQSDYDSGNFNWEIALVPDKELEWLRQELHEGKEPVIIFIHQLLDKGSGLYEGLYVKNAEQVNQVLIESQRVLAVFQGHHHEGSYSFQNHIHYFTMNGMIEGNFPENNAYAIVEVYPNKNIKLIGFRNTPSKDLKSC